MIFKPSATSGDIENWFETDEKFNQMYPPFIRELASMHWTPLKITRRVIQFLASGGYTKILDIGSGVGKFCLAAARCRPYAQIYGIEQRENLVEYANQAKNMLGFSNVSFHCGNFTQLNLKLYDHFYL